MGKGAQDTRIYRNPEPSEAGPGSPRRLPGPGSGGLVTETDRLDSALALLGQHLPDDRGVRVAQGFELPDTGFGVCLCTPANRPPAVCGSNSSG